MPYALVLYHRFERGTTVEELAAETGIPEDRIRQRLRAAENHLRRREQERGWPAALPPGRTCCDCASD